MKFEGFQWGQAPASGEPDYVGTRCGVYGSTHTHERKVGVEVLQATVCDALWVCILIIQPRRACCGSGHGRTLLFRENNSANRAIERRVEGEGRENQKNVQG